MLFVAEPGTQGTLVSIEPQDLRVEGEIPQVPPGAGQVQIINNIGDHLGQPYNPSRFKLTTLEGTEFIIDEFAGLISLKDLNDNTLTINNNGIVHSSGKSITWTRDSQGRISQLTDPNNNITTYTYNAVGDLVSVTDAENNVTSFSYINNHYLLDITDPRGIKPIRNDYDNNGRLIKHTDSFGNVINYTHQIGQRLETVTDRLGNPTIVEYDGNGNVVKQTDALGNVTTYTYDERDNPLTETNALGKSTTFTYDSVDNLLTKTDPLGNTNSYTYNARRQLLTITDPKGGVKTYSYDNKENITSIKDALNNTTSFTYNAVGLALTQTDEMGHVTHYQYTGTHPTQITDAQGHITTLTYDQNGNLLTQILTRTVNGTTQTLTTTNTYDKKNRSTKVTLPDSSFTGTTYNSISQVASTTDQLGRITSFTYDNQGQLLSTTYPDATTTSVTYDAEGKRLTFTDQLGRISRSQYDQLGRLIKSTAVDNSFNTITYDSIGRVMANTDSLGHTTTYTYDPNCGCTGRLTRTTDALGNITSVTYDQNGNQTSITDARNNTTSYTYDALNRQTRITFSDGTFQEIAYDVLGRQTSATDQDGKTKQFFYDSLGRTTKIKDALNQETQYTYDELGQQLTQVDAKGKTTQYEYDNLGRRTKRILPMGQVETYSYDSTSRLTSLRDFNNKVTTYSYDTLNNLIAKTPDPSLSQAPITFTYNALGQRTSMADSVGTTTYSYDIRNRLTQVVTPRGTITYVYNSLGNILSVNSSNPNTLPIEFGYDLLNRLQQVNDQNLAVGSNLTQYSYDQVGNLSNKMLPNGVSTTYQYNNLNRLTNTASSKGTTALSSYAYLVGNAGNRLRVSELSGRIVDYTYDPIYRLTNEAISGNTSTSLNGSVSYTYDQVGNRTSRTSTLAAISSQQNITVDDNDRLNSDNYDNNGNTVGAGDRSYTYDFENRIIGVTGNNLSITIKYDGDGNRVEKTVNGVTTKYLIDSNNLTGYPQVFQEIQNDQVVKQYTYGIDGVISQRQLINGQWVTSFYGKDGHGSVRYLTDVNGVITDTYDYDAFGNLINQTGNTPNTRLFASEEYDTDLGLYYNRARYLDTNRGRFWTQDSYEGENNDPESLHKYLYASANPVNNVDPSGEADFTVGGTLNVTYANASIKAGATFQAAAVYESTALAAYSGTFVVPSVTTAVATTTATTVVTSVAVKALAFTLAFALAVGVTALTKLKQEEEKRGYFYLAMYRFFDEGAEKVYEFKIGDKHGTRDPNGVLSVFIDSSNPLKFGSPMLVRFQKGDRHNGQVFDPFFEPWEIRVEHDPLGVGTPSENVPINMKHCSFFFFGVRNPYGKQDQGTIPTRLHQHALKMRNAYKPYRFQKGQIYNPWEGLTSKWFQ